MEVRQAEQLGTASASKPAASMSELPRRRDSSVLESVGFKGGGGFVINGKGDDPTT